MSAPARLALLAAAATKFELLTRASSQRQRRAQRSHAAAFAGRDLTAAALDDRGRIAHCRDAPASPWLSAWLLALYALGACLVVAGELGERRVRVQR